jgi:hypothetical protein
MVGAATPDGAQYSALLDDGLRRTARRTRATLPLATAVVCACGGGIVGGTPQPDGGARDASTANPLDAGATQPDADATAQLPDAGADAGGADGEGAADQSAADEPCAPFSTGPSLMPPTFDPPQRAPVMLGESWSITCPDGKPGDTTIFYTMDESIPTHSSAVYSGPVPFTSPGWQYVFAFCSSRSGCPWDSTFSTIAYDVPCGDGGCPDTMVTFDPPAGTMNNDFVSTLTTRAVGANICYTVDELGLPRCDTATCACAGGKPYNPAVGVPIVGASADPTGDVIVQAVACVAGAPQGPLAAAPYVLAVAAPTMTNPSPGTYSLSGDGGGLTPTLATATMNGTGSPVTISLTFDGSTPQCDGIYQQTNPVVFGDQHGSPPAITSTTTITAVACRQGYKTSNVASFVYTIQ